LIALNLLQSVATGCNRLTALNLLQQFVVVNLLQSYDSCQPVAIV